MAAAPRDEERCRSLDSSRGVWSAVAKGTGALGGTAGLAAVADIVDDEKAKDALIITGIGLAAASIASMTWADNRTDAWTRECAQ